MIPVIVLLLFLLVTELLENMFKQACCPVGRATLKEEGLCPKQLEIFLKTECKKEIISFDHES